MDTATGSVSEVPESGWGEWIAYDDSAAYFRTADASTTEIIAYYYDYVKNEVTGVYESAVYAIQLEGNKGAPTAVFPYCNKHEVTYLRYNDGNYGLRVTPDDSGFTYIVMSKEEIDALGIGNPLENDDVEWNIVRAEYVDDKLFFSVEISDHDSENDIGWRYYYTRRITYDYYKDLSTGEVILLQSY